MRALRFQVLHVEDNRAERELIGELLGAEGVDVYGVRDADACFAALAGRPPPDLVLLDLRLPGQDGHSILKRLKTDPDLGRVPVVILSSSQSPEDVDRAYRLHANAYVRKPVDLDTTADLLAALKRFWADHAILPSGSTRPSRM